MKVSLNLAQEYSSVDLKGIPREELLRLIGAQLGAVEEVTDWALKFEGAVIVRVVSCAKHPDADRLNVCRVDDGGQNKQVERGEDGLVQVVCGAPNVRAGMYAVWLAPGVVVPASRESDPFTLEARAIRGVVSNGMMASPKELGISDDHAGILDVTADDAGREPVPGEPLTAYFGLDDFVIDCENKMFTHRPDCFGNLGVARELAGICGQAFKSPEWYRTLPSFESRSDLSLSIKNEAPELVPRFMAIAMQGVTVRKSPVWLQAHLTRVGIKPINNVVDVTNYVMHLTGQPLHAFDYDKIKDHSNQPGIFPRMADKGEKLTLLGQKEITLSKDDIVIATDKQAVALAGVMGGADTEVDENTKNIIIECATFDMYAIRRTSMRHGLFTDAVTRYNKGQSPRQNPYVLAFAMQKMTELAGAAQASDIADIGDYPTEAHAVEVIVDYINDRLGTTLSSQEITKILQSVEFTVSSDDVLRIQPPYWRMDIEQPEDVVEEVGRLYGYDKLPVALPPRPAKPAPINELFQFKQQLRQKLKAAGANEVLTYSFVHGDLMRKTGTNPDDWAHHLRNAISPDLQYYRTSVMPSLLAKVHPNIKAQAGDDQNRFALYEIGRAHIKGHDDEQGLPIQMERLALIFAADEKTAASHYEGAPYYTALHYLQTITAGQAEFSALKDNAYPLTAPYVIGRSATVRIGRQLIGVIGEFTQQVRQSLKLPAYAAGFEVDVNLLMKHLSANAYEPLPQYPGSNQDVTFEAASDVIFADIAQSLQGAVRQAQAQDAIRCKIIPVDIFQAKSGSPKRFSFRLQLHHPDKTLRTEETNAFTDAVAQAMSAAGMTRI